MLHIPNYKWSACVCTRNRHDRWHSEADDVPLCRQFNHLHGGLHQSHDPPGQDIKWVTWQPPVTSLSKLPFWEMRLLSTIKRAVELKNSIHLESSHLHKHKWLTTDLNGIIAYRVFLHFKMCFKLMLHWKWHLYVCFLHRYVQGQIIRCRDAAELWRCKSISASGWILFFLKASNIQRDDTWQEYSESSEVKVAMLQLFWVVLYWKHM